MSSLSGSLKIVPVLISGLVSASSYAIAVLYNQDSPTQHSNVMLPPSLTPSCSETSGASGSAIVPLNVFSVFTGRMISEPHNGTRSEAK
jgi:hypothetical protein